MSDSQDDVHPDGESERCWLLSNLPPMTESGSTALLSVIGAAVCISSFVTRWSVGYGCLTLGAGGIRVRLEGISSAVNLNILLLFKWFLTHRMTRDITIVVGEMMQRHEI